MKGQWFQGEEIEKGNIGEPEELKARRAGDMAGS